MRAQIKKEMSKAIGSYSNSLTDSIAERCTEIALKYVEQPRQAAVSGSLLHDIYLFKVKDYTTILLGRYHDGKFYIQRGDGVKYEYEAYRVVWKRLLNCR